MISTLARRACVTLSLCAPLVAGACHFAHAAPMLPSALPSALPGYHLAATWKLAGEGGWDYLTDDSAAHRLYIARGTRIQVLDTQSGALLGEVAGLTGAHGVALVPRMGRGFATSGRDGHVVPFDLKTLAPVGAPIAVGESPDAITYEPKTDQIFAWNAGSENCSVIDPKTSRVVATIALTGNPEFGVADGKGNIFVNIESASQLTQIDAKTLKVVHVWPLAPGEEPSGLAYDAKNARLFSVCSNSTMIALDAKTGQILATIPIGEGVDAATYDATLQRAFSSNGRAATISIIDASAKAGGGKTANKKAAPALMSTLATHEGARTMALDAQTHALFVVAADYEATPAGTAPPRRPKMIPGSAVVLKYELDAAH